MVGINVVAQAFASILSVIAFLVGAFSINAALKYNDVTTEELQTTTLSWGQHVNIIKKDTDASCSLGYFGKKGNDIYVVTAEHCVNTSVDDKAYVKINGRRYVYGHVIHGEDGQEGVDAAAIKINTVKDPSSFTPLPPIIEPEKGNTVCLTGARSGEKCRNYDGDELVRNLKSEKQFLWFKLYCNYGDSGGVAYIKKGNDKRPIGQLARMSPEGGWDNRECGITTLENSYKTLGIQPIKEDKVEVKLTPAPLL